MSADGALRWSRSTTAWIWGAWLAVCAVLSAGPLVWHLDYFGRLGEGARWGAVALLTGHLVWAGLYCRIRRRGLWRHEPRLLAGAALAATAALRPGAALVWLAVVAAAAAAGSAALRRLGLVPESPAARLALAAGGGLGTLALVSIPLGLAGGYSPWSFAALGVATAALWRREFPVLLADLREAESRWRNDEGLRAPLAGVAVAFAPAYLASFLAPVLAPAIAYDGLAHHLPAANFYRATGRLAPLPLLAGADPGSDLFTLGHSTAYSYYPQTFEILLTAAWSLGGRAAAQLVAPTFFVLAAALAAAIGRLCGGSRAACALGAVAAATLPVAHWSGAIVKNDAPLVFFTLAALFAVLRARSAQSPPGWPVLAAFFCGLAMGVKHTAVYGVFPIGLLALDAIRRRPAPWRAALLCGSCFAAAGLFWQARAYFLAGNPLFPAQAGYVATPLPAVDGSHATPVRDRLLYPWVAHFEGRKTLEGPTDNPLGLWFVVFAAAWALVRNARRGPADDAERACWAFAAIYPLAWIYTWGVLRYGLPLFFVLATLTAKRAAALGAALPRATAGALAAVLAFGLPPTLILQVNPRQFLYFSGRLDEAGYLREVLPEYAAIEYLDRHAPPGALTLSLLGCAAAYARDPARHRCVDLRPPIGEDKAAALAAIATAAKADFLIVPSGDAAGLARRALAGAGYSREVFADARRIVLAR